ncbi:hypothetical protein LEP1GSC079_4779 [Leptospira interrogans str. FPW1039]|uniref:Uncharacterized protein n=1 Tax=Leptospira interrogans str. FPW1039 TaxID=1193040 RepID=A0A0F6IEE7_LEPIR|nr:hypothetical protein LEP1GSC087_0604 [Leptospira interrogans serovar Bataviae str. L1111]EKR82331.1 hypothetical protein LEP1GSC099_2416 [Leptospira interrogans str. UI 08452]EMJ36422.1 hypothetical protein LEP1GSC079_4779 [Leptospira interrogans str. FPW1039]
MIQVGEFLHLFFMEKSGFYQTNSCELVLKPSNVGTTTKI